MNHAACYNLSWGLVRFKFGSESESGDGRRGMEKEQELTTREC